MTLPTSMSDDNVCRWTGSAWDCALSSVAPGALIRTGVTAFSPWAVGYAAIADLSASNNGPTTPGSATTLSASITRGSVVTYTWVFGDGTTGSGQNPSHTYAAVGSYTATATATNASGSSSASTTVIVQYRMYIPGLFYNPVGAPARR